MSNKGNEILLRARQQFQGARTLQTLRKIDVPEWDATVYYWPSMSVEESRAVGQYLQVKDGELRLSLASTLDCAVANILHRARNEDGSLLFTDENEKALRTDVDEEVIKRVGAEMGFVRSSLEDAEGN